jgi:RimJ/RimL family protein N-acetyltransferase
MTRDIRLSDVPGAPAAPPFAIPTITTDRLILRPHRLEHFDAVARLWSDPDVVRFIGGVPSTREQSWARLLRYKGSWHFLGFGFWAIEERSSGLFVGEAGFLEARRGMEPSIEGTLETGWVLDPAAHGQGFATEALTAIIEWGASHFPSKRMTCIIAPGNIASIRLAEKLRFVEVAQTTYLGSEITLFERKRNG